jgi:hypothetical protein
MKIEIEVLELESLIRIARRLPGLPLVPLVEQSTAFGQCPASHPLGKAHEHCWMLSDHNGLHTSREGNQWP